MTRTGVAAALAFTAIAAMTFAEPARSGAQSEAAAVQEIDRLDQAVTDAWVKAPLTERRAIFVESPVETYGAWRERPDNVFKPGEDLLTYVEPVGYVWRDAGEGWFGFGFVMDFKVKTPDGRILGGQDAYKRFEFKTRYRNREVFINLKMSLSGIPAGDYVLVYTLHDLESEKSSSFEQPFRIAS